MEFFRCVKEFKGIKKKQVVINGHYHYYRTIIVADPKNKTIILHFQLNGNEIRSEEYFVPLTMDELNKFKPHLYRPLLINYYHSFNKYCLDKLPDYCCYDCGQKTFGTMPIMDKKYNSIGKCHSCKKEKQELLRTNYFKVDIFKSADNLLKAK